jgi:hypothetical protein
MMGGEAAILPVRDSNPMRVFSARFGSSASDPRA